MFGVFPCMEGTPGKNKERKKWLISFEICHCKNAKNKSEGKSYKLCLQKSKRV